VPGIFISDTVPPQVPSALQLHGRCPNICLRSLVRVVCIPAFVRRF
jgi:hypothetical protein